MTMELNSTLISTVSLLISVFTLISCVLSRHRDRIILRGKLFQKLELESNSLFRWIAENRTDILRIEGTQGSRPIAEDELLISCYYEQTFSLYELVIHGIRKGSYPEEIFIVWLNWIYDFVRRASVQSYFSQQQTLYCPEFIRVVKLAHQNPEFDTFKKEALEFLLPNHSIIEKLILRLRRLQLWD
jgi:hypothetical protein